MFEETREGRLLSVIDWKILLWGGGRTGRKAYALAMASFIAGGWLAHTGGLAVAYAVPGLIPFIAAPILILFHLRPVAYKAGSEEAQAAAEDAKAMPNLPAAR